MSPVRMRRSSLSISVTDSRVTSLRTGALTTNGPASRRKANAERAP